MHTDAQDAPPQPRASSRGSVRRYLFRDPTAVWRWEPLAPHGRAVQLRSTLRHAPPDYADVDRRVLRQVRDRRGLQRLDLQREEGGLPLQDPGHTRGGETLLRGDLRILGRCAWPGPRPRPCECEEPVVHCGGRPAERAWLHKRPQRARHPPHGRARETLDGVYTGVRAAGRVQPLAEQLLEWEAAGHDEDLELQRQLPHFPRRRRFVVARGV